VEETSTRVTVVDRSDVDNSGSDGAAVDRRSGPFWAGPIRFVRRCIPVVMLTVALVSGFLAVQRALVLVAWEAMFTGSGHFVVISCEPHNQWGPDQWHCPGRLTIDGGSTAVASTMVVSRGSMASFQPYVGQTWEVFFDPSDGSQAAGGDTPDYVYADQLQLSEIARLYISIIPRVLLSVGTAGWVFGWWYTRRSTSKPETWWVRRLPGMESLQRRAIGWIAVAFLSYLIYRLVAYYLVGSVSVA